MSLSPPFLEVPPASPRFPTSNQTHTLSQPLPSQQHAHETRPSHYLRSRCPICFGTPYPTVRDRIN
ncbi:hypothetical protein BS47DRAFT_1401306 [Hydnum rufescens UP504]|uniref:Uncharacterized protein n=1 Tax=Hydnum rufescens UP504 TaxID=1448309 RepID=A0A9P6AF11_9AGAM|nr:hypothetical protein BS47DRAFT_1401306 [Hydnum rufescens UP504]